MITLEGVRNPNRSPSNEALWKQAIADICQIFSEAVGLEAQAVPEFSPVTTARQPLRPASEALTEL